MIKCVFCQTVHVDNTVFCGECGNCMLKDETRDTTPLGINEIAWLGGSVDEPGSASLWPWSTPSFQPAASPLIMRLKIGAKKREVEIPLDRKVHLGRLDPASNIFPEIDLSMDGLLARGVSRCHAEILPQGDRVVIEDLASVNGTFVNGKRLAPYLPEPLNDGDTLQLGRLLIEVRIR